MMTPIRCTRLPKFLSTVVALPTAFALPADPATARIKCSNGFQMVRGVSLATPYCQDELVAIVARGYGFRTTPSAIRSNTSHKRQVCQIVGADNQVRHACVDTDGAGRRGF
ncbi:MAG: hypothetical protein ACT4N2_03640 [Hyphomicrobium sp.]